MGTLVTPRGSNAGHKAATKPGKVRVVKGKAAKSHATKSRGKVVTTGASLKGLDTAELLAMREKLPRTDLKGHYAIRRALRAGGYFISQNR